MSKESTPRVVVGCFGAFWLLFICFPMWVAMLHGILSACNPPSYVWLLFYVYIPVAFIGGVVQQVLKVLFTEDL
jgi:hypothetical protein